MIVVKDGDSSEVVTKNGFFEHKRSVVSRRMAGNLTLFGFRLILSNYEINLFIEVICRINAKEIINVRLHQTVCPKTTLTCPYTIERSAGLHKQEEVISICALKIEDGDVM